MSNKIVTSFSAVACIILVFAFAHTAHSFGWGDAWQVYDDKGNPIKCPVCGKWKIHTAIDLSAKADQEVYFTRPDYYYRQTGSDVGWGNCVVVGDKNNTHTYVIWHLSQIPYFREGKPVDTNKPIGIVYNLGSNSHIHYGKRNTPFDRTYSLKGALPACEHQAGDISNKDILIQWQSKHFNDKKFPENFVIPDKPYPVVKAPPLPSSSANSPPNPPTNLSQFRSDGVTGMGTGTTTNQSTVVLKGGISDPNNDTVMLQIELRGLGEYGGRFTGTPTLESPFLPNGSTATITVYGLINGSYHWRARTIDSKGATSSWVSAGNNPDSAADFIVSVGPPPIGGPQIASISPTQVQAGQVTLTVNGSNFDSGSMDQIYAPNGQYLRSGVQSGGLISRSSNHIVVRENLTSAQPGTYTVKIKNSDGKLSNPINIVVMAVPSPTPQPSPPLYITPTGNIKCVTPRKGEIVNDAWCFSKYGHGYCADYVKKRAKEKGIAISGWGDAKDWIKNAPTYSTGSEPKKDSIVVFRNSFSPLGHVAWVEEVYEKNFKISEWNAGKMICPECSITTKFGEYSERIIEKNNKNILGFIYVMEKEVKTIPTPPPTCTDGTQFVGDVSVPDGAQVRPGQGFTKTWKLRNTGTCSWGSGYSLFFVGGSQMGAPGSVSVPMASPNATVNISVSMVAPSTPGVHQSYWQMKNAKGQTFGPQIWVKINVASASPSPSPTPAPVPGPQIVSISPTQVQAGQFTLTISGSNFDSGAIDQLYTPSSQYIGSGAQSGGLISRTTTQIVVRENLTSAQAGTYVVRVRNSDGKLSNPVNIGVMAAPSPPPPSVTPPPPQPPVTPITIVARIEMVDVVPRGVRVGQGVTLRMKFTNTGTGTHTFIAGASLWRPDGDLNPDIDFEKAVTLAPGQTAEVSWSHQVERHGNWGYQFAVWKQKPFIPTNLLARQPSPIEFFSVSAAVVQPPVTPPVTPSPPPPPVTPPTPKPPVSPPIAQCADGLAFLSDVTIPDNTVMQPGQRFTKTWRLRNTGTCSWSSGYILTFVGGSQMGPSSVSVPLTPPNGVADISVAMVAPSTSGIYQSYWQMRNPKGQPFGPKIWVKINVAPASSTTSPTPTPTPPKPVPQVVSARIDDYSPKDPNNPVRVQVGGSTTLSVKFTNTGNTAWRFIVGASVWDSKGKVVGDYSTTLSAPLQSGQQMGLSWSHPVREAGDYWVQFGVWKATPFVGENLLEKKPAPAQKLIVGVKK